MRVLCKMRETTLAFLVLMTWWCLDEVLLDSSYGWSATIIWPVFIMLSVADTSTPRVSTVVLRRTRVVTECLPTSGRLSTFCDSWLDPVTLMDRWRFVYTACRSRTSSSPSRVPCMNSRLPPGRPPAADDDDDDTSLEAFVTRYMVYRPRFDLCRSRSYPGARVNRSSLA